LGIFNATFSGNSALKGGAINNGGTATMQNSIVANSTTGGNCGGDIVSRGYNLSSDETCNFSMRGDLNNIDPILGPLRNHGGPTQTMALQNGSAAIDSGNPSGCTDEAGHLLRIDQRGKPRPDKEDTRGCDMGAYERQTD
jgi:predicted outer membrane repeat protein